MSITRSRPDPGADLPEPRADTPGLRAFVAVAREGTVLGAARVIGRTQPSVSARLAGLEQAWRTRLFRRRSRGMTLTPEGARLLPLAEAALSGLAELDRVAGLPATSAGTLSIGSGDALGRELLPRALARLLREYPGLDVRLREGPGPVLLDALRAGEIDLALLVLSSADPAPEGIDVAPLLGSRVDLLAPPGTIVAKRGSVSLRSLAGQRWVVLQQGSGFRRHLEAAFAAAGLPFRPDVEVGNLSLVRRFVAAGLGVAPVPGVAFDNGGSRPRVERHRLTGVPSLKYHRALRAGAPIPETTRRLLVLLD